MEPLEPKMSKFWIFLNVMIFMQNKRIAAKERHPSDENVLGPYL